MVGVHLECAEQPVSGPNQEKELLKESLKAHDTKAAELVMRRASPTTSKKAVSSGGSQEGFRNKSTSLDY